MVKNTSRKTQGLMERPIVHYLLFCLYLAQVFGCNDVISSGLFNTAVDDL